MNTNDTSLRAVLRSCVGMPEEVFEPGAVLIPEGPSLDRMFILVRGEVEVRRGDVSVADVQEPGAIFGEMAALLGIGHSATVRAVTQTTVHRIENAGLFLQQHQEIAFHVARILARRLFDATTYLADIKRQFAHQSDHLGMVDEVLDALVQRQRPATPVGPSLKSDPRL